MPILQARGYEAARKVLTSSAPEDVIGIIKASGLRRQRRSRVPYRRLNGEAAMKQASRQKYMICNADEGDPGAFMDRSVIEAIPCCNRGDDNRRLFNRR